MNLQVMSSPVPPALQETIVHHLSEGEILDLNTPQGCFPHSDQMKMSAFKRTSVYDTADVVKKIQGCLVDKLDDVRAVLAM